MKKDIAFNCVREEIKKDIASNCDCGLTGGCTKCNFCWEESEEKQTKGGGKLPPPFEEKQTPQDWKERFIKKFAVKKPYWSNELREGVGIDELVDFIEVELKTN